MQERVYIDIKTHEVFPCFGASKLTARYFHVFFLEDQESQGRSTVIGFITVFDAMLTGIGNAVSNNSVCMGIR